MTRNPNRQNRLICMVWITCFLLQHCREVLLMNVQQMQEKEQRLRNSDHVKNNHETFPHRHSSHKKKQDKGGDKADAYYGTMNKDGFLSGYLSDPSGAVGSEAELSRFSEAKRDEELRSVIAIVKNVAKKIKIEHGKIANLYDIACNRNEFKRLHHFWKRHKVGYHLFLISGAVMTELGSCPEEMIRYVQRLVESLGSKDVIELLEESIPIIEYIGQVADNRGLEEDNEFLEPESGEYRRFKQMLHTLSDNIGKVHDFTDFLDSKNENDAKEKITNGLEEKTDEAIIEYDIISSLLDSQPDTKRKKRSVETYSTRATAIQSSIKDALLSFSSVSKGKIIQIHSKALTLIGKRSQNSTTSPNSKGVKTFPRSLDLETEQYRKRRSDEGHEPLILIRNQNFPCELLSICGNSFCFKPYDEKSLSNLLWVWDDGFLKHQATVKYVSIEEDSGVFSLRDQMPHQKLFLSNQRLFVGDNNCTVVAEYNGEGINLKSTCHKAAQTWSFINFNDAKLRISSIACLFLIQDIDTCSVVTMETNDREQHLTMKPINNGNILNQVWQWNNRAIRHYNSQKYLSRGSTGSSVGIVILSEISDEKWIFENNHLKVLGTTQKIILDTTKGKIIVNTFGKTRFNLTKATENEIANCDNGRYFAIKHVAEPCKVLCPKTVSTGPGFVLTAITTGVGFVTGMLVGLFSLACSERQRAVKIAFAAGVLSASTTAVVLEYSSLFRTEDHTVEFKDIIDAEPLTCLWYEYTGTLRSLDTNTSLHAEPSKDGVHWLLRLSVATKQTWLLQNGTLNGIINGSCDVYFRGAMVQNEEHTDNLLFSCEENTQKNTSWIKVYNDNTLNFRKQVVCMFFLRQTNEKTCAFLTAGRNSSEVRLQLHSDGNVLKQVWYLRGDLLENVGTGSIIGKNDSSFEKVPFNEADEVINILTSCHENMFFIKSETIPCNVLTATVNNGSFNLALTEYSTDTYFNQLWTKVEGHLYNIGTGTKVYISHDDSLSNVIISKATSIEYDVWKFENQTIIFSDASCALSADDQDGQIELVCKNSSRSRWSLVHFDKNFSFLNNLLCTFFIQNQHPPCAFLTANATKELVLLEYMASDVLRDQLWFKSDGRLVNLRSGLSLTLRPHGNEITISTDGSLTELRWIYKNGRIIERNTKQILNGFASVRLSGEKHIIVNGTQLWNFISSEMIMDHLNMFKCHSSTPHFFFLKSKTSPCELLTAINSKEVSFKVFEESLIETQLWYIENGRLFNVYTGNVLRFVENSTGIFKAELSEMLIFDNRQIIYTLHDKLVHVYNTSHECFLVYVTQDGESTLSCQLSEAKASEWKRIPFNEDMSNMDELLCLFFLKNKEAPCEYLTGYDETEVVKVRPLINELINTQLFYWKNDFIVHMQTGLLLTASIDRSSEITLEPEAIETETFFQRWSSLGSQIVSVSHYYFALEVDIHTDGKIILAKSYCENQTARTQQWSQLSYHSVIYQHESEMEYGCAEEKTEHNSTVFFIRSKEHPCLTLSGTDQGTIPHFAVFDLDDIERFLWIYDNHHIINFKSGLALMLDFEEGNSEHNVILWPQYAYSLAQKWTNRRNDLYLSGLKLSCFLHSGKFNGTVVLESKCANLNSSDIEMLTYDENADVLNNLTCTFFIKSNAEHCELLTGIGGNEIRTRPLLTDFIMQQLWYWKGNNLVNYGNNAVAVVSNMSQRIMLQNSNRSEGSYTWLYSNSFFKSQQFHNNFMTISEHSGEILIAPMLQTSPDLQHWILIDRDEGINNPDLLFCNDSHKERKLFVVRSEYDSCPILVKSKDNSVSTAKMSDSFSNSGLWMKDKHHILNVNDGNCLSIKESVVRGTSVFLQQKYFYEKLQRWSTGNDAIYSMYTNHSQYLTYTGSNVVMANRLANSPDKQKWKWYTVEQIESNDKLLRCSRCYNKGEETAAEVISYIPIFGWLYNIGRSIAYGAKNCPDVALSSLIDGIIDVAFDVVVGLSAGTASAFAYGVKTAMKLGIKAGINAAKMALRSMIKHTFKTVKTNIIKFVRLGIKKSLKNQLVRVRIKPKAAASLIKQRVVKLKSLKNRKICRLKSLFKNRLELTKKLKIKDIISYRKSLKGNIMKIKLSLTNIPNSVGRQADNFSKKVKEKLKSLGNSLSERAEKAIKREQTETAIKNEHDLQRSASGLHHRCKRVIGGDCHTGIVDTFKSIMNYDKKLPPISGQEDFFLNRLKHLESLETRGQTAGACVIKRGNIIKTEKDHINDLRKRKVKPEYKYKLPEKELETYGKRNVKHAEQSVIQKIDDTVIKKCNKQTPCEVILYTKLSPCTKRDPPNAITCLPYITEKCRKWFESYKTKCVIVFKETYTEDIFEENMEESLAGIFGKRTKENLFGDNLDDAIEFAKQNLGKIKARQSKVASDYDRLQFTGDQETLFTESLQKAIEIAKYDIRMFWDTLFGQLNVKFHTLKDKLDRAYGVETKSYIEDYVKKLIRIPLNNEAMNRKTVKEIYKSFNEAGTWIKFHRL